ncbi:MAG: molecular chaperone DnaJ [Firmicutes bacterium]|nr:molecular chaperone DnaJ [Bacillota bacterium]
MRTDLVREITPEEKELQKKLGELAALEAELAQRELDLVTFQAELAAFRNRYLQTLGKLYAELDAILAEIAALRARKKPPGHQAWQKAEQAWSKAQESAKAANEINEIKTKSKNFKPTSRLKQIYREIAKNFHPDLAANDEERNHYQQLMAEANQAYRNGDEQLLEKILLQAIHSPQAVKGVGTGVDLIRVIRKIAAVQERLKQITAEIAALKGSSLYKLKTNYETMKRKGIDLLAEMAGYLNRKIAEALVRLKRLKRGCPL